MNRCDPLGTGLSGINPEVGMGRKALATGFIAATAAAIVALTSAPAAAAVPPSDGAAQTIAFVGSDTTQDFSAAYIAGYTNNAGASVYGGWNNDNVANPSHEDNAVNVPAKLTAGQTVTVPADSECTADTTYGLGTGQTVPPDGSSAGRDALFAAANRTAGHTACIDVARSSSGPRAGTDPVPDASYYYGFALDAVSFATFGTSVNLTLQQIRDIYNCNITDWSGIPGSGKTGPIHRYLPQSGSGTRSFFISRILNNSFAPGTTACPLNELLQENDARDITAPAEQAAAILAYSAGQHVFQKAGEFHAVDKTNGVLVGSLGGVSPVIISGSTETVNAAAIKNGTFFGWRTLYNVLDKRLDTAFTAAQRVVGFNDLGNSPLCNGDLAGTITNFGFVPLDEQDNGTFCTETVVA